MCNKSIFVHQDWNKLIKIEINTIKAYFINCFKNTWAKLRIWGNFSRQLQKNWFDMNLTVVLKSTPHFNSLPTYLTRFVKWGRKEQIKTIYIFVFPVNFQKWSYKDLTRQRRHIWYFTKSRRLHSRNCNWTRRTAINSVHKFGSVFGVVAIWFVFNMFV